MLQIGEFSFISCLDAHFLLVLLSYRGLEVNIRADISISSEMPVAVTVSFKVGHLRESATDVPRCVGISRHLPARSKPG